MDDAVYEDELVEPAVIDSFIPGTETSADGFMGETSTANDYSQSSNTRSGDSGRQAAEANKSVDAGAKDGGGLWDNWKGITSSDTNAWDSGKSWSRL